MKKSFSFILILISSLFLFTGCSNTNNLDSNENIIHNQDKFKSDLLILLNTNSDAKEYLDYYSNSKINSIKYINQINTNISDPISNFYSDINLTDNLIEVLISSNNSQLKLISVINIKTNSVIKVAGIYEITMG